MNKRIIQQLKEDFLGIDLGKLIITWIIGIGGLSILMIFILPLLIGLTIVPKIGLGIAIFCLYLIICFFGSAITVGEIGNRFPWLRKLGRRWEHLSLGETEKIRDVIEETLNENKERLIKELGKDNFYKFIERKIEE